MPDYAVLLFVVKYWIVRGLERLRGLLDLLPFVWHETDGWQFYRYGLLGCYPLRVAQLSADLDERWGTDAWS